MEERYEPELQRYLESQLALSRRLNEASSLDAVAADFLAIACEFLGCEAGALWKWVEGASAPRFVAGWGTPALPEAPWRAEQPPLLETGRVPSGWQAIPVRFGPPGVGGGVAELYRRSPGRELSTGLAGFAEQLGAFAAKWSAEARRAESERLTEANRAEADRVRQHMAEVVRGTQDAVMSKDLDGIVTSWNPAAERLYGYSAEEAIGRHISFLVPPDHQGEEMRILDRVVHGERLETYETERIRADGARISVALTISQIRSPLRGVIGASVIARDITSENRQRKAQDFLVTASRLLDASLDPAETARTIVGTAIPELADFCVIDFVRDDGWLGDSVVAGVDPEAASTLERLRRVRPLDPAGEHPAAQVLRTGRPMIWRDLKAPAVIEQVAQSEEHRRLMESAGYNSAAVVGLSARGRTLGALSFLHAQPGQRFDATDLEFLAELGERAAMALDNALLYSERNEIADNLQRSLRPPRPAEVPGLEISVVFEAAGEGIEVGGDFYDVLPSEDGCWILIGDVAGKGSAAAAVSVAARHSVRGLTRAIAEPEEVLAGVNELLLAGRTLNDFATAQLLRLRREDGRWRLALVAAGHPPAVHLGAGRATLLGGGTMLGVQPEPELHRHEATLAAGETLVLCTDGWLEAGPTDAHREPEALAAVAASLAGTGLEELTARLRADAVERGGGAMRDDLVILAIRPAPETAGDAAAAELARAPQ